MIFIRLTFILFNQNLSLLDWLSKKKFFYGTVHLSKVDIKTYRAVAQFKSETKFLACFDSVLSEVTLAVYGLFLTSPQKTVTTTTALETWLISIFYKVKCGVDIVCTCTLPSCSTKTGDDFFLPFFFITATEIKPYMTHRMLNRHIRRSYCALAMGPCTFKNKDINCT